MQSGIQLFCKAAWVQGAHSGCVNAKDIVGSNFTPGYCPSNVAFLYKKHDDPTENYNLNLQLHSLCFWLQLFNKLFNSLHATCPALNAAERKLKCVHLCWWGMAGKILVFCTIAGGLPSGVLFSVLDHTSWSWRLIYFYSKCEQFTCMCLECGRKLV